VELLASALPKEEHVIYDFTDRDDLPAPTPWKVHGRRLVYDSPWVSIELVDVDPGSDKRYEHHVVRLPYQAVCVVVQHFVKGILLLYRHRFITDTAGFELPAGGIGQGESAVEAARREVLEETGWSIADPTVFMEANASDGVTDQRFIFVYARALRESAPPLDAYESQRLYWVPAQQIPNLVRRGLVPSCSAMFGLLYAQQFGFIE
jgi:8-oxo-dGTP pyrophosphatase MutT (NUDIX family)